MITASELRGGVFVLEGPRGNIDALATPEGRVLVDAGITETPRARDRR
jgi:hypothetical protein